MSLTARVLIGLVAGFAVGLALAGVTSPWASAVVALLSPVGTLFVNLIRMTVIPLVMSMLVANVGSMTASTSLGRVGARAAIIATGLLSIAAAFTVLVAAPTLTHLHIDQSAAMALRGQDTAGVTTANAPGGLGQWVQGVLSSIRR